MSAGIIKEIINNGYQGYEVLIQYITKEELEKIQEMFGW